MPRNVPPPHTGGRFPRESVLQAVRERPGLGVREIASLTRHSGITVSKHLAALRSSKKVLAVRSGRKLLHYLPGTSKPSADWWPEGAGEILAALADLPVTLPGLRTRFPHVPRSTLQYRVGRLIETGYIERDTNSRPATLNLTRKAAAVRQRSS